MTRGLADAVNSKQNLLPSSNCITLQQVSGLEQALGSCAQQITTYTKREVDNLVSNSGGGGSSSSGGTISPAVLATYAPLNNPTFTGTVNGINATMVGLGNVSNTSDANKPISTATQTALNLKANLASPTFTGTVSGITAAMVGSGNVNNTSDANKPISTATQNALNLLAPLASPTFTGTVNGITAAMVGLGNVF